MDIFNTMLEHLAGFLSCTIPEGPTKAIAAGVPWFCRQSSAETRSFSFQTLRHESVWLAAHSGLSQALQGQVECADNDEERARS